MHWILAIVAGMGIGLAAKTLRHIYIDWQYIESADLKGKAEIISKAKAAFGAVNVDEKGNVHTSIYVDRLPADSDKFELVNTGMKVEGKTVWSSTKDGVLILYADVRDISEVIKAVDEAIDGKGEIGGDKRFLDRLGLDKLFSRLKANFDFKSAGYKAGVIIDWGSTGKEIKYNKDGSMVVGSGLFENKFKPILSGDDNSVKRKKELINNAITKIKGNDDITVGFVCSQNQNRSALAHVLLQEELNKSGKTNVKVVSWGVGRSEDGKQLDQQYIDILRDMGISEEAYKSFYPEQYNALAWKA